MLVKTFLTILLVVIICYKKTSGAPAPEDDNHVDDGKHLPTRKISFYSTDPIREMPGEPLSPADFQNAKLLPLEPPLEDVVDGTVANEMGGLFEGDITGVLPRDAMTVVTGRQKATKLNNAVVDVTLTWPSGIVPYVISASFGQYERSFIAKAILEYHNKTCIRFVPRTNQEDYLNILSGNGCSSNVGRAGGEQQVSLGKGCIHVGVIMHELMHAVGFWHEQSRTDRDDHITIHWQNIIDGMAHNFQKYEQDQIQYLGSQYDTGSIMHYDAFAFAKDNSYPTITAKNKDNGKQLGQRDGFSEADVLKLKRLYKCETNLPEKSVSTVSPPTVSTEFPGKSKIKNGCIDEHKYCRIWMERGECTANPWMTIHCRLSCNLCEEDCDNYKKDNCIKWAQAGECKKNGEYMKMYCRKSCGYCGDLELSTAPKKKDYCVDDDRYCRVWAAMGDCETNPIFMLLHCKKSCGEC